MKSKLSLGIILIVLGAFFYTNQMLQISEDSLILLIISLPFFVIYFLRGGRKKYGNIGFLIPASILAMIGFGTMSTDILESFFSRRIEDIIIPFSIGTSFFLVYVLHTCHFKTKSSGNVKWPLYPMAVLYFIALISSVEVLPIENCLPALLIITGLFLIFLSIKGKKTKQPQQESSNDIVDLRENNTN